MQQVNFLLLEEVHIQVAVIFEPPLVGFGAERPDQPQAPGRIQEDADYSGALDLLVDPFGQVGRSEVLVVLSW